MICSLFEVNINRFDDSQNEQILRLDEICTNSSLIRFILIVVDSNLIDYIIIYNHNNLIEYPRYCDCFI